MWDFELARCARSLPFGSLARFARYLATLWLIRSLRSLLRMCGRDFGRPFERYSVSLFSSSLSLYLFFLFSPFSFFFLFLSLYLFLKLRRKKTSWGSDKEPDFHQRKPPSHGLVTIVVKSNYTGRRHTALWKSFKIVIQNCLPSVHKTCWHGFPDVCWFDDAVISCAEHTILIVTRYFLAIFLENKLRPAARAMWDLWVNLACGLVKPGRTGLK